MAKQSEQTAALQSNTDAYFILGIISIISIFALYLVIFGKPMITAVIFGLKARVYIAKYRRLTGGRNVIIMTHSQSGLFGSMITMTDCLKIERLLRKYQGTKVDFIVNTFGGELFSSIRIAHLMKNNPQVRVVVPKYAWSGGTLITLGAHQVMANPSTIFGPVDPQLGNLLYQFSAKHWKEIVDKKGKDAKDESIAFAKYSEQIMVEMKQYLKSIVGDRNVNLEKVHEIFLESAHTHGNMLSINDFKEAGIEVKTLETTLPDKIIESLYNISGVYGYGSTAKHKADKKAS
jgi:ClpP class serine protease